MPVLLQLPVTLDQAVAPALVLVPVPGQGRVPAPGSGSGSGSGGSAGSPGATTTCVAVTMAGSGPDCALLASSIEPCAQGCFSSAIPQVGCAITDYACQCGAANQAAALTVALLPCLQSFCAVSVLPSIIAEASAGQFCSVLAFELR